MRSEDPTGDYVPQEGPEDTAFTMIIGNALRREAPASPRSSVLNLFCRSARGCSHRAAHQHQWGITLS